MKPDTFSTGGEVNNVRLDVVEQNPSRSKYSYHTFSWQHKRWDYLGINLLWALVEQSGLSFTKFTFIIKRHWHAKLIEGCLLFCCGPVLFASDRFKVSDLLQNTDSTFLDFFVSRFQDTSDVHRLPIHSSLDWTFIESYHWMANFFFPNRRGPSKLNFQLSFTTRKLLRTL